MLIFQQTQILGLAKLAIPASRVWHSVHYLICIIPSVLDLKIFFPLFFLSTGLKLHLLDNLFKYYKAPYQCVTRCMQCLTM